MPYWRLSAFYFFFFASVGAFVPYWGLYLQTLGFSAIDIGLLMAILMASKIVSPNVWGWLADHSGRRVSIVRLGALLALLSFVGVFFVSDFMWMAICMVLFGFFWNATLPQYEVITLNHLLADSHRYTKIRVWGSVGFVVAVVLLGMGLEHFGVRLLPYVVIVLIAGIFLACLVTPADLSPVSDKRAERGFVALVAQPGVIALFVICFLMQASHGPYYTFFSIYLESLDYSRALVGQMWALGVMAEVLFFLVAHRLFKLMSLKSFMVLSLLLTTLRWILIAYFAENLAVLLFAQCLHAASFGIYHAVAIQLIHKYFVGSSQGRGQALYSSLSFGLGGALGGLYSGFLWEGAGPSVTYLFAAGLSFIAVLIAWRWLDRTSN